MAPLFFTLFLFSVFNSHLSGIEPSRTKIRAIYNSLDPSSFAEHVAFYELYSDTPEGKLALQDAWRLIVKAIPQLKNAQTPLPSLPYTIDAIVALVNKPPQEADFMLNEDELKGIEKIACWLPNRKLKGYGISSEEEVLALPPHQIDLARGILLSQLPYSKDRLNKIRSYEALLDMMALQIMTKLPSNPSHEKTIRAINDFVFEEMGYRFPPHSLFAKEIDTYTFLPSVLDSRRGVCLGVSILYLCLAQRLNLPLEMITPPGHIYVRYRNDQTEINIETTARGVHIDSEEYLGIETRSLQMRNIKEVIGLAHFNQAAVYWDRNEHAKTLQAYRKALPFLPNDMLLKELMGYACLITGEKEEGEELMKLVKDHLPEHAIAKQTVAEDYLSGNVNAEGIKTLFIRVDENRSSILEKKTALEKVLERYPKFRAGLFNLAATWLQLHRLDEALAALEKYQELEQSDPAAEYYMSVIYAERLDYKKAWNHLKNAERLTLARNHRPKALIKFRKSLNASFPNAT